MKPFYETIKLYAAGSESSLSKRKAPREFAAELAAYDVISFDAFDTLIFRPFSNPADLFYLLGEELGYPDFRRIRMETEQRARKKKYREKKTYEVTLEEIYDLLERETGIKKAEAMHRETELEEDYCFGNPYMLQVVEELQRMGKRIVVTSDMYLGEVRVRRMLEKCGYGSFSCYVSCDLGCSKWKGDLYDAVRKLEETRAGKTGLTFVHVGDNKAADVRNARRRGFASRYYGNVNTAGNRYRARDMSDITGSLYRGIVNARIHNGSEVFSREYEYGFLYGGLFAAGYCRFIHEQAEAKGADRILFLARDGDILLKAYLLLYPEERERCRYALWSRLAAAKMAAGYYKYDYFRRFLYHKVNQGYSMGQILVSMELEVLVEALCQECGLTEDTRLTGRNADRVKQFLLRRWEQVLERYEEQLEAGRQYYGELLIGCRKAVAVDIGWAGSGAMALDHIVNQIWKMDCEITGIIAGTNTCHNAEPDASEAFLQSGKLISYLYSQRENRDLWKFHDAGKGHNLNWEALVCSPHGSLKGFYLDRDGKCECRFKKMPAGKEQILEIQRGILDFVEAYKKTAAGSKVLEKISGRDAYAPMLLAESKWNHGFIKWTGRLPEEINVE